MSDHASTPLALTEDEVCSALLESPRKVWIQRGTSSRSASCLVVLDAELYLERVRAPQIVAEEQMAGRIPNVNCVYVSSLSAAARHVDYTCNPEYAQFLATDLIAWIERQIEPHERYILCGLSLSGLQAAFTTLRYPEAFPAALCQSPSAWWNKEWLTRHLFELTTRSQRFWLSVGAAELQQEVSHPPTSLYQGVSQLDSCRCLTTTLQSAGHLVRPHEYTGGHDPNCWASELPEALHWLLNE